MPDSLRAAILGLRHLHPRSYMPLLQAQPELQPCAAAECDARLLESFASEFCLSAYRDWRGLLADERPDLALIFLPHNECPEALSACAELGIHALVEKPMAATSAALRGALDAAARAGIVVSSPYVWRYHPVARQMKQFVDAGALGRVVACQGRYAAGRLHRYLDGHAGWMLSKATSGGGPMHNLGVHWIDLYRWILNDEVVSVLGQNVRANQEFDIEDNAFALLTFSRGTVVVLDISYTVPDSYPNGRDLYLGLRGSAGVLSWSPAFESNAESLFVCSDAPDFASAPQRHIQFALPVQPGYCGVLGHQYLADLVGAIRKGTAPPITGEDGWQALRVVEAVYESARTGRVVGL